MAVEVLFRAQEALKSGNEAEAENWQDAENAIYSIKYVDLKKAEIISGRDLRLIDEDIRRCDKTISDLDKMLKLRQVYAAARKIVFPEAKDV